MLGHNMQILPTYIFFCIFMALSLSSSLHPKSNHCFFTPMNLKAFSSSKYWRCPQNSNAQPFFFFFFSQLLLYFPSCVKVQASSQGQVEGRPSHLVSPSVTCNVISSCSICRLPCLLTSVRQT